MNRIFSSTSDVFSRLSGIDVLASIHIYRDPEDCFIQLYMHVVFIIHGMVVICQIIVSHAVEPV
jgi:hypothetical protein